MPPKVILTDAKKERFIELFLGDKSVKEFHEEHDYGRVILPFWNEYFGEEEVKKRRSRLIGLSHKNGRRVYPKGVKHYKFKQVQITNVGYIRVERPDWYKGPYEKANKVSEHILNYCLSRGYEKIPDNNIIHHLNENKSDNRVKNLIMLSASDHMKLHSHLRRGGKRAKKQQPIDRAR
jgi:hypothetical protein